MEEQEVLRLFGLFTGLSEEEAAGWAVLCRSTIAELTGRLRPGVDPASDANRERLSAAAAAMASCLSSIAIPPAWADTPFNVI